MDGFDKVGVITLEQKCPRCGQSPVWWDWIMAEKGCEWCGLRINLMEMSDASREAAKHIAEMG